jgi:hypothetical protein
MMRGVPGQATSCCTAFKVNAKALALFSSPVVTPSATRNSGLLLRGRTTACACRFQHTQRRSQRCGLCKTHHGCTWGQPSTKDVGRHELIQHPQTLVTYALRGGVEWFRECGRWMITRQRSQRHVRGRRFPVKQSRPHDQAKSSLIGERLRPDLVLSIERKLLAQKQILSLQRRAGTER